MNMKKRIKITFYGEKLKNRIIINNPHTDIHICNIDLLCMFSS
jgi:hypothetical protein